MKLHIASVCAALAVSGCGGSSPVRPNSGIELSASLFERPSSPGVFQPRVRVSNVTADSLDVVIPSSCSMSVRVYAPSTQEAWAWDQAHWLEQTGQVEACTSDGERASVAPGASKTAYGLLVTSSTILGDSLPGGTYEVRIHLERSDEAGGPTELRAGMYSLR